MEVQQRYCEDCNDCYYDDAWENKCQDDVNNSEDCSVECDNIDNMEENGYEDASEFVECQQLEVENSSEEYYAGAVCASNGSRIKIGVFTDDQCINYDETKNVEDYLKKKEGYATPFQTTYSMKLSYPSLCR